MLLVYSASILSGFSQMQPKSKEGVFENLSPLPLKFSYSNKKMRKASSTENYAKSVMYFMKDQVWDSIPVELKARGNFRRTNCYFPPVKLKIKGSEAKGTVFEGYKKMKVVLPCKLQKRSNDEVLKEYLAYKLYEPISPAHFKTRLVDLEYTNDPSKKVADEPLLAIYREFNTNTSTPINDSAFARKRPRTHHLRAILIEDDKNVAQRNNAQVLDRFVHPLAQDDIAATRNAFFQYMIGNTDFSTAYGHNQKLLFLNKKAVPIPYDFDMSGLVNASYSVVSNINNQNLPINNVTQRLYRGFKRDSEIAQHVRTEFLNHKKKLLQTIDDFRVHFDDQKTYQNSKKYILEFFNILENESKFQNEILDKARTK